MWELFRVLYKRTFKESMVKGTSFVRVVRGKEILLTIFVKKNFIDDELFILQEANKFYLDVKNIKCLQSEDIFCIVVESEGFKEHDSLLEHFYDWEFKKFILLRSPFSKNQSLYYYLTYEESIHEPTHKAFGDISFNEFLESRFVEDSWVIRNFLNIPYTDSLTEENYKAVIEILKSFYTVSDYKQVEKTVDKVFLECWNVEIKQIEEKFYEEIYGSINRSKSPKADLESFSQTIQQKFLERTYWDKKLYDYFIERC
jgi:hypothetical protein